MLLLQNTSIVVGETNAKFSFPTGLNDWTIESKYCEPKSLAKTSEKITTEMKLTSVSILLRKLE